MKVYLRTYGCRANHYDSEVVQAMVTRAGAEMVDDPAAADVAVFNSCAVTREAEADLRQGVRRAARSRAGLRTVVMGCAAALDRGALRELPGVSHVVPGADPLAVAEALALPSTALGAATEQGTSRAVLRIQDGCDEHCTFCATTLARGANRSRPLDELVREATQLADHHPEIVLTGIHIGTWGADSGSSLGVLVQALMEAVPTVRFRLSSIEATEVDDALLECLQHPRQLAPHLHAPLQSGSDAVLKRMGRHWYTAARYREALLRIVGTRSVFGLGADVMTGFPGESDQDHRATLGLVSELPFTYLHVFPYSERPGTAAARLGANVAPAVAQARAQELRLLGQQRQEGYRQRRAHGAADVVVEGGDHQRALTEDYLSVRLTEPVPRRTRHTVHLRPSDGGQLRAEFPISRPA